MDRKGSGYGIERRQRGAAAALILAALAATVAATGVQADDGAAEAGDEPRMVAFFFSRKGQARAICPQGWSPLEEARGRLVLGTDPQRMTPPSAPPNAYGYSLFGEHRHALKLHYRMPYKTLDVRWDGTNPFLTRTGQLTLAGQSITYEDSHPLRTGGLPDQNPPQGDVPGAVSSWGRWQFPYMRLLLCQRDDTPAAREQQKQLTQALPRDTVLFFNGRRCPGGSRYNQWQPYQPALGRFVVTTMPGGQTGAVRGTPARQGFSGDHAHPGGAFAWSLTSQGIADWQWFSGTYWYLMDRIEVSYGELTGIADGNPQIAHVELLPCIKYDGRPDPTYRTLLPHHLSIFSAAQECDGEAGWETAPNSGRLLVGLGDGEAPIDPSGDELGPGFSLTHTHHIKGEFQPEAVNVSVMTGTGYQYLARPVSQQGEWETEPSDQELPTVLLRHCTLRP
jgi:hypothetical protein